MMSDCVKQDERSHEDAQLNPLSAKFLEIHLEMEWVDL